MVSNTTYDIISTVAERYVPDTHHSELHVNSRDMWISLMVNMVNKGLIKPKMAAIIKCAYNWEALLTLKYSRLN